MDKDTALELSISIFEFTGGKESEAYWQMVEVAKSACKEALEQPAQEPAAYIKNIGNEGIISFAGILDEGAYPVYTHPHQWQGLTDDENEAIIQSIWEWGNDFPYDEYRICIEQALKDKNHGI